jgi:hypothetical protein
MARRTTTLRCTERGCGRYLVRTESDYWACPKGHGGLHLTEARGDLHLFPEDALDRQPVEDFFGTTDGGD